ncbi:DUF4440 domain-containing protein [Streptomyces sp. SPB074]|uniref:nuclear transport factor 2 family protein n=1 Tax=Streptomyces sp. (strain SPB074) TaxID=465543 RepID=UPI0001D1E180|nr:nuclear transport factor 2 family protein [Streptomyces sp. SPB074]EDY45780.2 conserved hypothetical protein [Streptomyces sp. SPB074]
MTVGTPREPRTGHDPREGHRSGENPGLAEVVARELRMLRPEVRRDPAALLRDLHPEFHEVGASGRLWDRAAVAAELSPATPPGATPTRVTAMTATRLAPGLVHLRWDTDDGHRAVRRASLWRREPGSREWLLWFHQGSPYARGGVDAPRTPGAP